MVHNTPIDEMSTSGTHRGFQSDARVPRAAAVLKSLSSQEISRLITARLARRFEEEGGLPPCQKDEEPTAIFVDVIKFAQDSSLANNLRFACVQALRRIGFDPSPNAELLGDLCYLAAAIDARESVDVLPTFIENPAIGELRLGNGETIRLRALRSLIGLLAAAPCRSPGLKALLEELLEHQRYRMLALTGLIGLWPEERGRYSLAGIDENLLRLNLELAGFRSA